MSLDVSLGPQHESLTLRPPVEAAEVSSDQRRLLKTSKRSPHYDTGSRRRIERAVRPDAEDRRPSDATLDHFRAGDPAAFDVVFRFYYPRLCEFVACTFHVDLEDAEDIVQSSFIKIWRILDQLPRHVSTPACLFQVARTQALEVLDKRSRRARLSDARGIPTFQSAPAQPDEATHHRMLLEEIRSAIADFPRRCRDAFWLRRVMGLSYAEIGHALGMEPRTAETHVRDGHRRLRERLTSHEL